MSPSGLHSFLGGTSPQYATVRKLTRWYVREAQRDTDSPDTYSFSAAFDILLRSLPPAARRRTTRALLELLRGAYADARVPLPDGLRQLLAGSQSGTG